MKKIILILALALGVKVNAQIVGGYLPVNSTKSATMGGLRVNGNETVTGTFSVGSTATITGGIITPTINVTSGTSFYLGSKTGVARIDNSSGSFRFLNSGDAFSSTQTGALTVAGNLISTGTHSLGSANLTGGNTGTVAVLSDAVFPVYLTGGAGTPADGTTYYIGGVFVGYWWNANTSKIRLPYNCTLVGWDLNWIGTPGTGEAATVSINGTTNYTLSSSITFSNVAAAETYTASGLSQNFSAGDTFNIKMVSPTWATNPTALYLGITLWFVRRS